MTLGHWESQTVLGVFKKMDWKIIFINENSEWFMKNIETKWFFLYNCTIYFIIIFPYKSKIWDIGAANIIFSNIIFAISQKNPLIFNSLNYLRFVDKLTSLQRKFFLDWFFWVGSLTFWIFFKWPRPGDLTWC